LNTNSSFRGRQLPYDSPLANALVILVGVLAIAVSFVIGVVALFAIGAAVMILAAVIGIRVWWFNRKLRRQANRGGSSRTRTTGRQPQNVIEGEYRVVRNPDDVNHDH